ncbi:putative anthocyanidin reductase isoform X2 [Camellia sinensis]|uniref:putative anthocyanidin reductase isoform X2 n=1 Tax=Camellia sinensis TaxID=4442 RepID=UPI001036B410|nr:putative anthocyanidin reductase isoform X2 [Camellia sinensis]
MEDTKSKLQEGSAVESLTTTTYCVTGATGYIGSWLVKSLLQRGYRVHATVRNQAKTLHLLPLWGGGDRLRVFRADLHKEGSFNEAVQGCSGVFHVAASMEFEVPAKEDIELEDSYVSANVIEPAINGTLNLLKSCLKTPSVRRVVFTSSISTMTAKDSARKWRSVVDESCQNPIDRVWKTKTGAWVYVLSKLLTEEAAFKFANESSIDLVSVITTTVAGPFLTSTVPTSVQVLLSPITGDSKFSRILSAVNSRMGSIALVHIEDICSAHIFLLEHDGAEGRYICSAHSSVISQLVDLLAKEHPFSNMQRHVEEEHGSVPSEISSKKLRDLGFNFKFGLEDIIHHTVSSCVDCGFLCPTVN